MFLNSVVYSTLCVNSLTFMSFLHKDIKKEGRKPSPLSKFTNHLV